MSCAWYSTRWVAKTSSALTRRVSPIGVSENSASKFALVASGGWPGNRPSPAWATAWLRKAYIAQLTLRCAVGSRSTS